MEATGNFKEAIKAYCDARALNDEAFAEKMRKPEKSIDKCCGYILQQVRKSGCVGFTDEEVYGMAVHYFDEESINVPDMRWDNCRVVVNHVVEITDKDRAEAREKALKRLEDQELNALRKKAAKKPVKAERPSEKPVAKQKEETNQLSLF